MSCCTRGVVYDDFDGQFYSCPIHNGDFQNVAHWRWVAKDALATANQLAQRLDDERQRNDRLQQRLREARHR